MKRRLYLLRHSYAEPPGSNSDSERNLTMEGQSTARALGRKLLTDRFNPDVILCSPAHRAEQTAINITEELGINEQMISFKERIYEASVRELLQELNEIDKAKKSALMIGHNPSITYFAEYLTSSGIDGGGMEPCSLITISFDGLNWSEISQGSGIFVSYYHPNE